MRILIVTGASGGHIFPATSFLKTLKDKRKSIDTLLVLPLHRRIILENASIEDCSGSVKYVSITSFKPGFDFRNILATCRLLKGVLQSLFIILEYRPEIVVGFGSIVSIPMVILARLFRIKTMIHEQNVFPGRANRFLAKFADRIAVSFADTGDYLRIAQDKITLTGNPIRPELRKVNRSEALNYFAFAKDRFTILVMGGSQGSERVNKYFLKAVSVINKRHNLQIIHISGIGDNAFLLDSYKSLNVNVKLFSFLREMQYAYSASDLVVCRAGATTIAELIDFALPAVIIPYPFAHKHQLDNAKFIQGLGAATVIDDDELESGILNKVLASLIDNPEDLQLMRSAYNKNIRFNAREKFLEAALA